MKNSVTSQLKLSIEKVTGKVFQQLVYSDSRKSGLAVGVKVCFTKYDQPIIDKVIEDMESKGYKHAYTKYNQPDPNSKYAQFYSVPGQRFCFYKKD